MSDDVPELGYERALPQKMSRLRMGTWIMLLVVGVLTVVVGTCVGGIVATFHWIAGVVVFPIPVTLGVIEIVCSIKLGRGSRKAAVVAAVAVGLQTVIFGALATLGTITDRGPNAALEDGITYGLILVIHGVLEWLLVRVMRERRGLVG